VVAMAVASPSFGVAMSGVATVAVAGYFLGGANFIYTHFSGGYNVII